jgi:hypothetical protein
MNSPIRHSVTLGAFTLAIGLVTFAIFLVSARSGSPSMPEMCARTGPEVTEEAPYLAENDAAMKKMGATWR